MLTYWLMYSIVVAMALFLGRSYQYNLILWSIIGIFFTIVIGYRHEVGGDWFNYLSIMIMLWKSHSKMLCMVVTLGISF